MSNELDLKDIYYIIKKRLLLIIALVVIASTAAALVSFYVLTPVYEASTKIVVNRSNDKAEATSADMMNEVNLNLRLIDTYKEIIKTPAIMDVVVSQYPDLGLTAGELMQKVSVSSVNNTQVMTIKVQDESYERAASTVNAVSNVFKDKISDIYKVDNVSILSEAKLSPVPSPVKPSPVLNIAIAFLVSLMLGVGIAFLLEYMDDTMKTERDIAQLLELPLLGVVPEYKMSQTDNQQAKQVREGLQHVTVEK